MARGAAGPGGPAGLQSRHGAAAPRQEGSTPSPLRPGEGTAERLRALPSVGRLATAVARAELAERRAELLAGADDEVDLAARARDRVGPSLRRVLNATGVVVHTNLGRAPLAHAARAAVARVQLASEVLDYVVDVCRATRTSPSLQLGVSPRGATALLGAARAWAWLSGRDYVTPDDVKALARPALRHRIQLRAEAELEGVTPDSVLDGVLASVPVPR